MKRSQINTIIREAKDFLQQNSFHLPPFAHWTPDDWRKKGNEVREIVDRRLGWDVTDFGQGTFSTVGLTVFTMRNGDAATSAKSQGKLYAEKILISNVDQVTPMHFHWTKVEDIINRGGGKLAIQVYNSTEDGQLDDTDATVHTDGVERKVGAGDTLILGCGESITIPTGLYHKFWGVEERALIGEVSMVNDDAKDNRFAEPIGRFPDIEEDEPPLHLLCIDYPGYYHPL